MGNGMRGIVNTCTVVGIFWDLFYLDYGAEFSVRWWCIFCM